LAIDTAPEYQDQKSEVVPLDQTFLTRWKQAKDGETDLAFIDAYRLYKRFGLGLIGREMNEKGEICETKKRDQL